ncbi:MAG: hypothetical protein M1820_008068, partial [Bogoriella megaspora]
SMRNATDYQKLDRQSPPGISLIRPSLDDAHPASSDDDDYSEDYVNESDPLNNGPRYGVWNDGSNRLKRSQAGLNDSFTEKILLSQIPLRRREWRRLMSPSRSCCILVLIGVAVSLLLFSAGGWWVINDGAASPYGESPPYYPTPRGGKFGSWPDSYRKAATLVKQMTLAEKVNVTTGVGWSMEMCVGNTGSVPRLSFPSLCLQDGPLGLRFADHATAWPAGVTVGATWNKQLMHMRGQKQALEARLKGINILLGPSVGPLGRMPAGGRNWEGFSPDPVLAGWGASQTIRGIQQEGVIATVKHYVGNEQEHFRQAWEWGLPNAISSNIDDRTLHELYGWPFMDAVGAGVGSVMCSYNQVNNSYACQNSKLLNGYLKDELGFQGFVQSDWLAQRSGVASALAGLDMSMPGDGLKWADGQSLWGKELTKAVLNGSVPVDRINDMVTRIVATWYHMQQDNTLTWPLPPPEGDGGPNFSSWTNNETGLLHPGSSDRKTGIVNKFLDVQNVGKGADSHKLLARVIAAEGTVLVENVDNMLPLTRDGWSENEKPDSGKHCRVAILGEDAAANPKGPNACEDRGCNVGTLGQGWGSGTAEYPYLVAPIDALRKEFNNETVVLSEHTSNDIWSASDLHDQDVCIVFVNSDGGEGYIAAGGIKGDRNDLHLQKGGDDLVQHVAINCGAGNGKVVVVVHAVGPVIVEPWIEHAAIKAVIFAHLPSQESGNAIADILFGDRNPSGRLPYTVGKRLEDYGAGGQIMYSSGSSLSPQQNFTEGLYIDYRWFDKNDITPRYEFGYGLSYTTFELSGLKIEHVAPNNNSFPGPPNGGAPTPQYPVKIPNPADSVLPANFTKISKYIYPWVDSVSEIKHGQYPWPRGYTWTHPFPPAGGNQGGHADLWQRNINVEVQVANMGERDGASVVQLYIGFPQNVFDHVWNSTHFENCTLGMPNDPKTANASNPLNSFLDEQGKNITKCDDETQWEYNPRIDFPLRVLRAFERMEVPAGAKKTASFDLTRRDLSYWDVGKQNWRIPDGEFEFYVGFSSRDLPLKAKGRVIGEQNGLIA